MSARWARVPAVLLRPARGSRCWPGVRVTGHLGAGVLRAACGVLRAPGQAGGGDGRGRDLSAVAPSGSVGEPDHQAGDEGNPRAVQVARRCWNSCGLPTRDRGVLRVPRRSEGLEITVRPSGRTAPLQLNRPLRRRSSRWQRSALNRLHLRGLPRWPVTTARVVLGGRRTASRIRSKAYNYRGDAPRSMIGVPGSWYTSQCPDAGVREFRLPLCCYLLVPPTSPVVTCRCRGADQAGWVRNHDRVPILITVAGVARRYAVTLPLRVASHVNSSWPTSLSAGDPR